MPHKAAVNNRIIKMVTMSLKVVFISVKQSRWCQNTWQASNPPGDTMRLSRTDWILVTRLVMAAWREGEGGDT